MISKTHFHSICLSLCLSICFSFFQLLNNSCAAQNTSWRASLSQANVFVEKGNASKASESFKDATVKAKAESKLSCQDIRQLSKTVDCILVLKQNDFAKKYGHLSKKAQDPHFKRMCNEMIVLYTLLLDVSEKHLGKNDKEVQTMRGLVAQLKQTLTRF